MLCEKYFILKLSLFFLLQFTDLNTVVAQKFLSPDEFYQSLQSDQSNVEATTLATELYKPIAAPTESSVTSPISNNNNNNNNNAIPTQPDVRDHRPTANTIETESSANVQNQLPNGETTQGGKQAKEKITRQDLSDPFFIRKNEIRESESVSGNGVDNWSKATSSHKSFEEVPRYPNNNNANNNQQNNMFPHPIYAQQRPNIPYPMSRPNNVFSQTNTHVPGPFVPQQTFNSINPSSHLSSLPPHIQSLYAQHLARAQQHQQQQQPFEPFNFLPQMSPNTFGSFQTSINDNGNTRTYSWHSSSDDDNEYNPSSQFNRFQQMSSDPFNAMLASSSNSGGYRSFSTMGDDGQWHTNVETW